MVVQSERMQRHSRFLRFRFQYSDRKEENRDCIQIVWELQTERVIFGCRLVGLIYLVTQLEVRKRLVN